MSSGCKFAGISDELPLSEILIGERIKMTSYNYKEGKKRILDILNAKLEVKEKEIPNDENFTYSNGYYGWITAVFVDIRESSKIFSLDNKEKTSKIIRSFTSEVIEILRDNDKMREIGIRGDCVYAIYSSPKISDIVEYCDRAYYINTFINMLNKLLDTKGYRNIDVGIGISTAKELVVKAGRKDTGINNKVWIGDAVTKASNLSSIGSKNDKKRICMSTITYSNIIDSCIEKNGEKSKGWFKYYKDEDYGPYYNCSIIKTQFDEWIDNGMV